MRNEGDENLGRMNVAEFSPNTEVISGSINGFCTLYDEYVFRARCYLLQRLDTRDRHSKMWFLRLLTHHLGVSSRTSSEILDDLMQQGILTADYGWYSVGIVGTT